MPVTEYIPVDFDSSRRPDEYTQILRIKEDGLAELQSLDAEKYGYKNGFPEATVNQLMYFAFQHGMREGKKLGIIEGEFNQVQAFRKVMAPVLDELQMIPAEDAEDSWL